MSTLGPFVYVKVGDTHVRLDLIEAINDQFVITLEGTPYQLGDGQDAVSVLADMAEKLARAAHLRQDLR